MILHDQTPKLSKWFFLLSDALLLAVAAFIATRSARPLSLPVVLSIVGCVAIGAVITALAFIADYTRAQDEALDDRQRALESLARTVASSAEQISIAAGGLHGIADLALKNLRHAEQLPHKLQEKIAEFQAQLANANDADKEELEKELVALRTTESERLESISDKLAKSTAEWAKLEAATQKHLAAAAEAIAQAQTGALAALDGKFASSLSALDAKLAACTELVDRALNAAAKPIPPAVDYPPAADAPAPAAGSSPAGVELTTAHPPKRPRKPRSEEPAAEEPAADSPGVPAAEPAPPSTAEAPPLAEEPPPIPAEKIAEITPVAPHTAEPFSGQIAASAPADAPAAPPPPAPAAAPKPARKRAAKKPAPAADSALGLDLPDAPVAPDPVRSEPSETVFAIAPSAEPVESVLTSDGATRLLVTAYIGIGNRLFIRGDGPGLSWDKGVPLQFVSIGKWRWETHDATAPVKFKLYKNDDTECAALGAQVLAHAHQQEVTAAF